MLSDSYYAHIPNYPAQVTLPEPATIRSACDHLVGKSKSIALDGWQFWYGVYPSFDLMAAAFDAWKTETGCDLPQMWVRSDYKTHRLLIGIRPKEPLPTQHLEQLHLFAS